MSITKEVFYDMAELSKKSVRIFDDACDEGVPTNKGDSTWQMMSQMAQVWGGIPATHGNTRTVTLNILNEFTPSPTRFSYLLNYVRIPVTKDGVKYKGYCNIVPLSASAESMLNSFKHRI